MCSWETNLGRGVGGIMAASYLDACHRGAGVDFHHMSH